MSSSATPAAIPFEACAYVGTVVHKRLRPRPHGFAYRVFCLALDLDDLDATAARLRLFSRNRFNLLSLHDADYGARDGRAAADQIRGVLAEAGLAAAGGRIVLLSYPRLLGYAFNPLAVFFCHDAAGGLRAIVYEVTNTYGERTAYVLPVETPDAPVIGQGCDKSMSVSPFTGPEGRYGFHVRPLGEEALVGVNLRDAEGPLLKTHFRGHRRALTDTTIAGLVARHPLMTAKVIGAIHLEAARLLFKGVAVVKRRPGPRYRLVVVPAANKSPEPIPVQTLEPKLAHAW